MDGTRYEDLGFARVDHDRLHRRGYPEAIYSTGKTLEEILAIGESLLRSGASNVLVTRASAATLARLLERFGDVDLVPEAGLCVLKPVRRPGVGRVAVVTSRRDDV